MSVRLNCPSCNHAFDLAAVPESRRATCPRCGDVFPVRGEVAESTAPAAPTLPNAATQTPDTPAKGGWSIGKVAAAALAIGLIGFAVGYVAYSRGAKPEPPPQPEASTAAGVTPPGQLTGLGYLPAESNFVFAIQPGPLIEHAARTNQEPRDLLARSGLPPQLLAALDGLGVPLAQIDHLAGGAFLPSGDEDLRVALVLVLKRPLADEDVFLTRLKAKPVPGNKSRHTVTLDKVLITPVLARVAPTVWVFGLNAGDLAAVDRGGFGPGGTQFRGGADEGVRRMLLSVPPTAAVWAAADDDRDWAEKPVVKVLAQSQDAKEWLPVLSGGRGGAFALSFGETPRMALFVRAADAATADRLRAYFGARAAEVESASAGGGGTLARFDAPFDAALVQRMLADASK
jgi:hypothetical protein